MKSLHNIILAIGIFMTAGGVAGVGLLYRDMKTENLIHAKTGMLPVNLSERSDWKSTTFTLYQSGIYNICLSTTAQVNITEYRGTFEINILAPNGTTVFQKNISVAHLTAQKPGPPGWIPVDTLRIDDPTKHSWTLRVRVTDPDSLFTETETEFFILPPQQYDIESYLTSNMYKLLGMGLMVLTGFMLIVYSGSLRKRPT